MRDLAGQGGTDTWRFLVSRRHTRHADKGVVSWIFCVTGGGPHTCLNMNMTQDHEKLDSNLIATCVVGTYLMFILCYFCVNCHLNVVILLTGMIREDPSSEEELGQKLGYILGK